MSGMKVLPRYRIKESGVGCTEHDDPTCLCDVVIGEQVPILRTEHKYHQLALNELNDDTVSERNLHEFFTIVLGLYTLERSFTTHHSKELRRAAFQMLPPHVADAIHHHSRADSPKYIVMMELEGLGLSKAEVAKVAAAYSQLSGQVRARVRRDGDRKPPTKMTTSESDSKRYKARLAKMEADPEYAERQREAKRRRDREFRAKRKVGKTWLEAKHTGPTLVPGTREL